MTIMYHDGNRRLQDEFDSRRIADKLEEKLTRTQFTADDKAFIEGSVYFFLAWQSQWLHFLIVPGFYDFDNVIERLQYLCLSSYQN